MGKGFVLWWVMSKVVSPQRSGYVREKKGEFAARPQENDDKCRWTIGVRLVVSWRHGGSRT